jgi:hypothetical protein
VYLVGFLILGSSSKCCKGGGGGWSLRKSFPTDLMKARKIQRNRNDRTYRAWLPCPVGYNERKKKPVNLNIDFDNFFVVESFQNEFEV